MITDEIVIFCVFILNCKTSDFFKIIIPIICIAIMKRLDIKIMWTILKVVKTSKELLFVGNLKWFT